VSLSSNSEHYSFHHQPDSKTLKSIKEESPMPYANQKGDTREHYSSPQSSEESCSRMPSGNPTDQTNTAGDQDQQDQEQAITED
jgi:hypothetical protein